MRRSGWKSGEEWKVEVTGPVEPVRHVLTGVAVDHVQQDRQAEPVGLELER